MEMLVLFGVCVAAAALAGVFGWQQGRRPHNGYVPPIDPPGPEGIPQRVPNLTGNEPYCR